MALGLAGISFGVLLIGWFGFGHVLGAATAIGWRGFALVCAWQIILFAVLGLCWWVLLPPGPAWRLWVLVWGRMVRDAAGGCLPFSLVAGFVLGARAVVLHRVTWPVAAASTVVDLTTEFFAQIGLVLIGVVILAARAPGSAALAPLGLGVAAAVGIGAAFVWLQRGGVSPLVRLSRRLLGDWVDLPMAEVHRTLGAIYASPGRVAAGVALHLLGWFGTGVASFLAFRLLGADIDFWGALGIEALLHAVLAGAVLVPGYAGVQEAAYAGVGALFGQPPELALGVSIVRRARDLALGVPILLAWQVIEWRRRRAVMVPDGMAR